ncbi:hypothetical protein DCAR_0104336 [Daucus carota subsp. sativus]|uniref:Uncharacterized protein n=1 Tax=Daucus carota subsp. sativus TaxID=79200 RepID=A0AAF0W9U5_DAUCS|nr:PREDICTED: uncharacterized protein LOC108204645 isoform X2 [Daucus carota subsp. sativus]WOG85149.1 hypothetical protein DCAR_0104336 [Daucus carota subsp. sativus]
MTSLHRAGKHPVDTDTVGILGRPSAPFGNPSNQHFPVTIQSPMQVTEGPRNDVVAERSDQIESNRLGQNSTYPPS